VLEFEAGTDMFSSKVGFRVSFEKAFSRLLRDRQGSEHDETIVFGHAWQRDFPSHKNIFIPADSSTLFMTAIPK